MKTYLYIIITFIHVFQYISCIDPEMIVLSHYFSLSKGFILIIRVGFPCDPILINMNMALDKNVIIANEPYKSTESKTVQLLEKEPITFFNEELSSQKANDILIISNKFNLTDFIFNIITEHEHYGTLGLAYKFKDESRSFLKLMKDKYLIDRMAFAFGPENSEEDEGEVYFGGLPRAIKKGKEAATIKVKEKEQYWGCNLQYIYIGSEKEKGFAVKGFSYFQSNTKYIKVPQSFFSYLNNNLFKEYILTQECFIIQTDTSKQFKCNCSVIKNFPTMTFVIDGIAFDFFNTELFENYHYKTCDYYIMTDLTNKNNEWILGVSFYHNSYTLFDYEGKSIDFYREKRKFREDDVSLYLPKEEEEIETFHIKLYVLLFIVLLLISDIIIIIINKYNNHLY